MHFNKNLHSVRGFNNISDHFKHNATELTAPESKKCRKLMYEGGVRSEYDMFRFSTFLSNQKMTPLIFYLSLECIAV